MRPTYSQYRGEAMLKKLEPYAYLAPSVILLVIFIYIPVVENVQFSFYNFNPFSISKKFIGLLNYKFLFKDSVFYTAMKNNVWYAVISMIFQVCGGLLIAAILEDKVFRRVSGLFRTVFFLPVLISMSVIGLLFNFLYNPTGIINQVMKAIGLGHYTTGWLGNSHTAIFAVIAVSQWQSVGYIAMLLIVAIQKIPYELYEAARIDGATKIRAFFRITVPLVKEMTLVTSVVTLSGAFLVFSEVFILTNGGPGYSSEVLSTYMYHKAFINNQMGYASAIANVILVITLVLSLIQMKMFRTGKE
jgi:raffinose/stachyose/melibiose transport system permease protein